MLYITCFPYHYYTESNKQITTTTDRQPGDFAIPLENMAMISNNIRMRLYSNFYCIMYKCQLNYELQGVITFVF